MVVAEARRHMLNIGSIGDLEISGVALNGEPVAIVGGQLLRAPGESSEHAIR